MMLLAGEDEEPTDMVEASRGFEFFTIFPDRCKTLTACIFGTTIAMDL